MWKNRLRRIQDEIEELHKKEMHGWPALSVDKRVQADLSRLEAEKQHELERRDGWLPKSVWNIIVPIVVSVISTVIVTQLIP